MMQQRWPERLWIVRHGESAGNVARDAAHAAGLSHIDIADRDVDVPLSPSASSNRRPSDGGLQASRLRSAPTWC